MYGVNRLNMLQELYLANNCILTIEGLKELVQLRHLDLHGNSIKTVEHLNTNQQLEYLNLSDNSIGNITDISMLKKLKVSLPVKSLHRMVMKLHGTASAAPTVCTSHPIYIVSMIRTIDPLRATNIPVNPFFFVRLQPILFRFLSCIRNCICMEIV